MGPGVAGLEKSLQPLAGEESSLGWGCAVLEGRSISEAGTHVACEFGWWAGGNVLNS